MVQQYGPTVQNAVDLVFSHLTKQIIDQGTSIQTRNATTKRLINQMATFEKTPLVTVRRTAWKNALREFEWFMSGSSNINDLHPSVHSWWKPWADNRGEVTNNYSKQFREFAGCYYDGGGGYETITTDQIQHMERTLEVDPGSRRNVITTWNTAEMTASETPITNCHGTVIQAFVEPGDRVWLSMYQRSCDMMLGVPHNWIQYWAFMLYLAHKSGRKPGGFRWIGGDCHVYPDHENMVQRVYDEVMKETYDIPDLIYNPTSEEFKADDFSLSCKYEPRIKESLKMTV